MVAATCRRKTLGERSLGHPDPSDLDVFILKFMSEFLSSGN